MWGHFLPGKRYSPAFSNHQIGNLRDGYEPPQLNAAEPDLWGAHPGMPENVTSLGDTGWIGGLTKVTIYPACTNSL